MDRDYHDQCKSDARLDPERISRQRAISHLAESAMASGDSASGNYAGAQTSPARSRVTLENVDSRITLENVERVFTEQSLHYLQLESLALVREALLAAARAILRNVPACADRTSAIRHLRLARMEAHAAIALEGEI